MRTLADRRERLHRAGALRGSCRSRGTRSARSCAGPARSPPARAPLGDLGDGARLAGRSPRRSPDCVMHLAAEIASQRSERKVREVNVAGTAPPARRLSRARGTADNGPPGRVRLDRGHRRRPRRAARPRTRRCRCRRRTGAPSRRASGSCSSSGLPAVVVRPSHVYGPGGWYAEELVPRLRRPGRFAVIGRGENLWDVVHVEDVAARSLLARRAGRPPARSTTWSTTSRSPSTTSWR